MSDLFEQQPAIKPVWQVIPQFFKYPLNASVLPMLIILSLASVLALIPFIGFFVSLLIWATLFKISYEILSSTARGEMSGPPAVSEVSGAIMFKHIGLLIGMWLGYVLLVGATGSLPLAIGLALFLMLALPAAIMTLAMTQSLLQALNPVTWVEIMRTTKASYLLTAVFLFLMLLSKGQVEAIMLPLLGTSMLSLALMLVASTFISAYFMAASFHLMGYLLYQYHEDFGIEVDASSQRERPNRGADHPLLQEVTQMVSEGQAEEAASYLGREIQRNGAEPPVHEYYRKLLHSRGDHAALVAHGREYVSILIHGIEDESRALAVAEECLELDRSFQPANLEDIRKLARLAFDRGQHKLVLRLTSGFGKQHKQHPHVVDNYLLAARSMVAYKGQREQALKIVQKLRRRYPDHPLQQELAQFEQQLGGTVEPASA